MGTEDGEPKTAEVGEEACELHHLNTDLRCSIKG